MRDPNDEAHAMFEDVVALLCESRRRGWDIALAHTGDLAGRARFEITIWRTNPAEKSASSPAEGRAGNLAGDDPYTSSPLKDPTP